MASISFIPQALTALLQACNSSQINYHSLLYLTFKHSAMHRPTPFPRVTFRARLPRSILIQNPFTIILTQMTHGRSYTNPESSNKLFRQVTRPTKSPRSAAFAHPSTHATNTYPPCSAHSAPVHTHVHCHCHATGNYQGYDSEGLAPRLRSLKERISKGAQLHIRTGSLSSLANLGSTLSSPAKQSHHLPPINVNMVVMGP